MTSLFLHVFAFLSYRYIKFLYNIQSVFSFQGCTGDSCGGGARLTEVIDVLHPSKTCTTSIPNFPEMQRYLPRGGFLNGDLWVCISEALQVLSIHICHSLCVNFCQFVKRLACL